MRAALALAEAEAHLARCVHLERRYLIVMAETARCTTEAATFKILSKIFTEPVEQFVTRFIKSGYEDPSKRPAARKLMRSIPRNLRRQFKIIRRYRREAEARRRKALRHWLAVAFSPSAEPEGETKSQYA